jgi:hypothetical protein
MLLPRKALPCFPVEDRISEARGKRIGQSEEKKASLSLFTVYYLQLTVFQENGMCPWLSAIHRL